MGGFYEDQLQGTHRIEKFSNWQQILTRFGKVLENWVGGVVCRTCGCFGRKKTLAILAQWLMGTDEIVF